VCKGQQGGAKGPLGVYQGQEGCSGSKDNRGRGKGRGPGQAQGQGPGPGQAAQEEKATLLEWLKGKVAAIEY